MQQPANMQLSSGMNGEMAADAPRLIAQLVQTRYHNGLKANLPRLGSLRQNIQQEAMLGCTVVMQNTDTNHR